MQQTKVYSVYTDELRELKDGFTGSIKDDWDMNIEYWRNTTENAPNFYKRRDELLIEKIKENWGQIIIWSDIDVRFYARCSGHIDLAMSGKDVVYLADRWPEKEVNRGFAAIRCNDKALKLYIAVLEYRQAALAVSGRDIINEVLSKNSIGIDWDVLPNQFWAMSHYMYNQSFPPFGIVLHLANCTTAAMINGKRIGIAELKLQQFELVKNYVLSKKEEIKLNSAANA